MKSQKFEAILDDVAKAAFGRSRKDDACVCCGSTTIKPEDFKDALSLKEFGISRMCQACQNSVFDGPHDDELDYPCELCGEHEVDWNFGKELCTECFEGKLDQEPYDR